MIRLTALSAKGYRSLRSIRLDVGQVGLFVGENGVGKSNLYRALQLVRAAANGSLAREIAAEGGMQSAMWSGVRRLHEPARVILRVELEDDDGGAAYAYDVEIGLPPPVSAAFALEPHVKEEVLSVTAGRRCVEMLTRKGPAGVGRGGGGRRGGDPRALRARRIRPQSRGRQRARSLAQLAFLSRLPQRCRIAGAHAGAGNGCAYA